MTDLERYQKRCEFLKDLEETIQQKINAHEVETGDLVTDIGVSIIENFYIDMPKRETLPATVFTTIVPFLECQ